MIESPLVLTLVVPVFRLHVGLQEKIRFRNKGFGSGGTDAERSQFFFVVHQLDGSKREGGEMFCSTGRSFSSQRMPDRDPSGERAAIQSQSTRTGTWEPAQDHGRTHSDLFKISSNQFILIMTLLSGLMTVDPESLWSFRSLKSQVSQDSPLLEDC